MAVLNTDGYTLIDYIPFGSHKLTITSPSGEQLYGPFRFKKGKSLTLHLTLGEFAKGKKPAAKVIEQDMVEVTK